MKQTSPIRHYSLKHDEARYRDSFFFNTIKKIQSMYRDK